MLKNGLDVKKLTKQVGYTTWRALTERPEGFEKVNLQLSFLLEKVTVQLAKTTSYYQKNEKRLVSVRLSQTKKQDLKGGNRQLELASYRGRLTWGSCNIRFAAKLNGHIQRIIIYGFRGDHGKPRHESERGEPKPVTWYNERLLVSTRHWGPSTGAGDPRPAHAGRGSPTGRPRAGSQ